jgi:tetratricopeptide (TPR) repeat protein
MSGKLATPGFSECGVRSCEAIILDLEQAIPGHPDDPNFHYHLGVCYSGACREHSMVSPELALEHLRLAVSASRERAEPSLQAAMLSLLGITYVRSSSLPEKARLRAAIECYEKAAAIYFAQSLFREWARMQFNLGNAWCELSEGDFPDRWEKAIYHYQQALLFRDKQDDPQAFAATLENLGTAYRARPAGDKAANVGKAIQCYRRALRIWTATGAPRQWAALHNNLGNAYLSLPLRDARAGSSAARKAIRHFDLALRVRTREGSLFDYGVTQMNRGHAYLRVGLADSPPDLAEAANSLREAHAAFVKAGRCAEASIAVRGLELINQALNHVSPQSTQGR